MPVFNRRRLLATGFLLTCLLAVALPGLLSRPPTPRYAVTDLGALPGDTRSRAYAINAQGQACGFSQNISKQACLFSNGVVTPLGRLPRGAESIARDINARGDMTGNIGPVQTTQAFVYSHGKMRLLGTLPGFSTSEGAAISLQGDVVGEAQNLSRARFEDAFLYSRGKMVDIGTSFAGVGTQGRSINATGQVAGVSYPVVGRVKFAPFLYDSRAKTMALLPMPPPYIYGSADHVNDAGQAAGNVSGRGISHAALWSGGHLTDLGAPPGFDDSDAEDLNNHGVIVGRCYLEDTAIHTFLQQHTSGFVERYLSRETQRAFVSQNGKIETLDSLIPSGADWALIEASAVNDRGQIVGYGLHHGLEHAFLLTPVQP